MQTKKEAYVFPMESNENKRGGECISLIGCRNKDYSSKEFKYSINSYVIGNEIKLSVSNSDREIKADIVVKKEEKIKVWGKIKDYKGLGAAHVKVKLISVRRENSKCIAEAVTNESGCYKFMANPDCNAYKYRIIAYKD